jgi:hypothetical protein
MPLSTARCGEVRVMLNDWLDTLLRGELDMVVPGVTLVQGNGASFTGSGRVQWLAGSDVRVSAVTNGAQSLLARFGRVWPFGRLIPREDYVHLSGRSQDGWDVETIPVPTEGYSIRDDSSDVVWDFSTDGLTLAPNSISSHRTIARH